MLDSPEALQEWLLNALAERLDVDATTIDVTERFNQYGLESLMATSLVAELSGVLGRALPPTLLWDHPTVERVVAYLLHGDTGAPADAEPGSAAPLPSSNEPIAIVGMACRFPGAPDLESYWRLLCDGVDAIEEVPESRWSIEEYYDADRSVPGKMNTRWGGFLEGIEGFDAAFFGISPREAAQMDPQQRLFLELSWEALEDAGIPAQTLKGSRTSVYAGVMASDFGRLGGVQGGAITQHTATGLDTSIVAARVSYTLGLQGPSMTVNTACSSSLVATHLACQSLRSGESAVAIAGGVNLLVTPDGTILMSKFGGMAPDGRSKAFDARANGYVRAEGGGVVVLKTLSRALADGDPIHCVIRGSAVNNDGFSNGLVAPNPKAQEAMLRDACARAGVDPRTIDYVEAHGTGTAIGDPIEAGALGAVLGAGRPADEALVVGSVKTNIGHLEAAAGMAGLIKTTLAIEHDRIPGLLHLQEPSPSIAFEALGLTLPQGGEPFRKLSGRARAGVSSFGFGGTNCHVVLEELPQSTARAFTLAADDEAGLRAAAATLAASARGGAEGWGELAAAVGPGGAQRATFVASDRDELAALLEDPEAFAAARYVAADDGPRERPVFVFSGNGSQWFGMARDLLRSEPVFHATLVRCDAALAELADWSLVGELLADERASRLCEIGVSQTLLFGVQVALAELWRSRGVEPAAVVGHSGAEASAACVAGALTIEEAARVVYHRSRLQARHVGEGKMAVVPLSWEATERRLAGRGDVCVAGSNAPDQTVISGVPAAVEGLVAEFGAEGVDAALVRVEIASHSPQMAPVAEELRAALADLVPTRTAVELISTVTGAPLAGTALDADYWVRNVLEPVRYHAACEHLLAAGHRTFLEIAPHPILRWPTDRTLAAAGLDARTIASLVRDEDGQRCLLVAEAALERALVARAAPADDEAQLIVFSAHDADALRDLVERTVDDVERDPSLGMADLAASNALHRSHLDERLSLVVRGREGFLASARAFLAGDLPLGAARGRRLTAHQPRVAYVLSGMGSQWWPMARELYRTEPVFRRTIDRCDALFRRHVDWSVVDELHCAEDEARLDDMIAAQPLVFSVQVALARLLESWGITPDVVVGHSAGEATSACVSGGLSLEDAVQVCFARSGILHKVAGIGRMLAVGLTEEEAQPYIDEYGGRIEIGAYNSPTSLTLSGDIEPIEELAAKLEAAGVFARIPRIDLAGHSFQMAPLQDELIANVGDIEPLDPRFTLYSTVTGEPLGAGALGPEYWWHNLRQPVRFRHAIDALIDRGVDLFVELAPHPVLSPSVAQCVEARSSGQAVLPTMRRAEPEREVLLGTLGTLFTLGAPIDWRGVHRRGARLVRPPHYPWQREVFWPEDPGGERGGSRWSNHPLLGRSVRSMQTAWEFTVRPDSPEYLQDHRVQGGVVFPAAGYLEALFAASTEAFGSGVALTVRSLDLPHAMLLAEDATTTVQVALAYQGDGVWNFEINSRHEDTGLVTAHASGVVKQNVETPPRAADLDVLRRGCTQPVEREDAYRAFSELGLEYGGRFQGIRQLWINDDEAFASLATEEETGSYLGHPALTDAAIQTLLAAAGSGIESTHLPVGFDRLDLYGRLDGSIYCHARVTSQSVRGFSGEFSIFSEQGEVLMRVRGLRFRSLEATAGRSRDASEFHFVERWQALRPPFPAPAEVEQTVLERMPEWSEETARIAKVEGRMADVERLCSGYARRAFEQLGHDFAAEPAPAAAELIERLGIDAAHGRFVPLLLGVIERHPAVPGEDPDALFERLLAECPEFTLELTLLERVAGRNLAEILRTPSLALNLLFEDDTIQRWYTESPTYRLFVEQMTASVEALIAGAPDDRVIRILEVGAGTGALPSFLFERLPARRVEYVYTDISAMFFAEAKAKFAAYPFVRYTTLNLEQDPVEQGFEPESFDLVLANDVLHATRDLHETLGNIRRLLAPGGDLVILDVTDCPTWIDMVFGCIDGWWRFVDLDLRPHHATASRATWHAVLGECGFDAVASVANAPEDEYVHSVITARRGGDFAPRADSGAARRLVFADADGFADGLVERWASEGGESVVVVPGDALAPLDGRRYACPLGDPAAVADLLARVGPVDEVVHLASLDDPDAAIGLLHLSQALLARGEEELPRLVIVTRGAQVDGGAPEQAPSVGFGRTLANEHPELALLMVDLDGASTPDSCAELLRLALPTNEVAVRGGDLLVPRLLRSEPEPETALVPSGSPTRFRLEIKEPGSVQRVHYYETPRAAPGPGEVEVEVLASSLNFIDVVSVMRMHPDPSFYDPTSPNFHPLGGECAGRVVAVGEGVDDLAPGDPVIAIGNYCMASHVTTQRDLVALKPDALSFEQAAAIPDVFLTVYYALAVLGQLQPGERVLIHSAAGGVGLAAIQYARHVGAEIYATAGTEEKRAMLRGMGIEHVMNSRTLDWAEEVMELTDGQGVDVVLNSLAGDAIPKGLGVLGTYGRFLELGVRDIYDDAKIGLAPFQRDLSFFAIDLHRMTEVRPARIRAMLETVLGMFADGSLEPLPFTAFPASTPVEAFRHMTRGTHVGKVLLDWTPPQSYAVAPSERFFEPDASYLVTGGLGGFGLTMVEWMARHGARNLVLTGRRSASTTRARRLIRKLEARGVRVLLGRADASDRDQMAAVLDSIPANGLPPLRGVFHLAMVLDDDFIERLDAERFQRVMKPKALGGAVIDELTQDLDLDWFVCFSSSAGLVGNPQQSNYVAANAYLDALTRKRARSGRPAITINWGVLAGVGRVARSRRLAEMQEARGLLAFTPDEALEALTAILQQRPTQHCFMHVDWQAVSRVWHASPRVRHLCRPESEGAGDADMEGLSLRDRLLTKVGSLLGIASSTIDTAMPLSRLGLDSLMAFDLLSWLETSAAIKVSQLELLDGATIDHLVAKGS